MEDANKHISEKFGDSKYNRQAAVWLGVVAVLAVVLIVIGVNYIGSLSFGVDEKRPDSEIKATAEPADEEVDEVEPVAEDDIEVVDTIPLLVEPAPKDEAGVAYEKDATIGEIDYSTEVDDAVAAAEKAVEDAKKAVEEAIGEAERAAEEAVKPAAKSSKHKKYQYDIPSLDELERQNHADVVRMAREAGVSTRGSTTEILERINHADVVKMAREAGVSTQGSTTEILERINHADVVRMAREAGVSTRGSTTEILERINRKELSEY